MIESVRVIEANTILGALEQAKTPAKQKEFEPFCSFAEKNPEEAQKILPPIDENGHTLYYCFDIVETTGEKGRVAIDWVAAGHWEGGKFKVGWLPRDRKWRGKFYDRVVVEKPK